MASIMWDYGVRSVIILHRDDAYGLGFVNQFKPAWFFRGGEFAGEAISYPADAANFTSYLEAANLQAQAAREKYPDGNQVGILLLSFEEDALIVPQIENYLPLYDCVVFSGFTHIGLKMIDYFVGSPQANHLKVFNLYSHPFIQSIINDVNSRHPTVSGFDDQDTYLYDAAWAIATSVLETRSVDAGVVAGVFPDVCGRLYGASGWCKLDQSGDRAPLPLDVYYYVNNHRGYAGLYNPESDSTIWSIDERLTLLSDDGWVKSQISKSFPGFPVVSYLGNVTNTAEKLRDLTQPNMARIVVRVTGRHPEYFRWFTVSQSVSDPVQWDPANHYHVGVITSDLEVYDLGLDVGFE
jgi:hypothetical protein